MSAKAKTFKIVLTKGEPVIMRAVDVHYNVKDGVWKFKKPHNSGEVSIDASLVKSVEME